MWKITAELYRRWRREVDLVMGEGPDRVYRLRRANAISLLVAGVPATLLVFLSGSGGWAERGWLSRAACVAAGVWFVLVIGATVHAYVVASIRQWQHDNAERLPDSRVVPERGPAPTPRSREKPPMRFEVEGRRVVIGPTEAQLRRCILGLRGDGPSSFASLTDGTGDYIQVGGGGQTCVLERRDAKTGRHYRAYRQTPSAVFTDGTKLVFSAGEMPLAADEWFDSETVLAGFIAFLNRVDPPSDLLWRDVTATLGGAA